MDNSIMFQMIKNSKSSVKLDENNLLAIDDRINELNIQITELEERLVYIEEVKLVDRLEIKRQEFEVSTGHICEVLYDEETDKIHTWYIKDTKITPPETEPPFGEEPETIYRYLGVGWDEDTILTECVTDHDWIYDLLHKELDETGTYGLIPTKELMEKGKNATQNNLVKMGDVQTIFMRNMPLT